MWIKVGNVMVKKRDGRKTEFDAEKIRQALQRSFKAVDEKITDEDNIIISRIVDSVSANQGNTDCDVEQIQDIVEKKLMSSNRKDVAKAYILYRQERTNARENTIDKVVSEIVTSSNKYWNDENSNKDEKLATTQRDYIAGAVSADQTRRKLLPKDVVKAHDEGLIHFHDADYYLQTIHNCDLINLEDMLQNGTVISGKTIDKPHKFSTACTIATQIIAQVASSQYGGQSFSMAHLSPFIKESYKTFKKKFPNFSDEQIEQLVNMDIADGVQTIQYQITTLMTTNGQAPFVTLYLNINEVEEGEERDNLAKAIREVLTQRIKGVKNEVGVWTSPAFPKIIYALDENNITEDAPYWDLTVLAAQCTAKRMVPDYISNKIMREYKNGDVYTCMGCRSFLTPDRTTENYARAKNYDKYAGHKYYGRFNQGVVTINLVDVACSSNKNYDEFWKIFEERLELCHKALRCRHDRLLGTPSDIAPILWQHGALARLDKGEVINELLYHGYSTISLGYAGLYECVKYMTGKSHTDEEAKPFALQIMQKMNDKCAEWKEAEDIDYSLYGTPMESTTYKFASCLRKRFGVIPDVTDHDYITNSYHVCVREKINAFDKLKFEAEFQKLSPGGMISYCETPNMQGNIDAVLDIIKFIYNHIMYAELNTKSDYCHKCGYDGEMVIKGEQGNPYWECPNCGNRDKNQMTIVRRTCGYLGEHYWNIGRTEEIRDRVLHVSNSVINKE